MLPIYNNKQTKTTQQQSNLTTHNLHFISLQMGKDRVKKNDTADDTKTNTASNTTATESKSSNAKGGKKEKGGKKKH